MSGGSEGDGKNGGGRPEHNRGEGDGGSGGDGRSERDGETSTAEKAVILLSVAVTLLLFAYAGWQMAFGPTSAAPPQVTVEGTERLANDSVAVTVRLRNPGDVGLITASVQSNCSSPPQTVQFSYVPAASTRTGTLVCPPDTTDPSVSMANWISR